MIIGFQHQLLRSGALFIALPEAFFPSLFKYTIVQTGFYYLQKELDALFSGFYLLFVNMAGLQSGFNPLHEKFSYLMTGFYTRFIDLIRPFAEFDALHSGFDNRHAGFPGKMDCLRCKLNRSLPKLRSW